MATEYCEFLCVHYQICAANANNDGMPQAFRDEAAEMLSYADSCTTTEDPGFELGESFCNIIASTLALIEAGVIIEDAADSTD